MIEWRRLGFFLKRMDPFMLAAIGALIAVGILFIFSAGYRGEDLPASPFYRKQILWSLIGAGFLLGAVVADYRRLGEQALPIYLIGLAVLVLVLVVGREINGAKRWLNFLGTPVQPSEFAKLATVLALARFLSLPDQDKTTWACLVKTTGLAAAPFLLIAIEPDLGTALVLVPVVGVLLFLGGLPWRKFGLLLLVGLSLLPAGWFALGNYQRERVLVFLDPGRDPLGAGWNKIQSGIAIGSGGLKGKGYLEGTQNVLGYLPRTVAPTDFIFSVIAEETGFLGSAGLLSLFAVVMATGVRAALRARDKFGQLLAAGLVTLLFCHVFVNIAMTAGLLPITGLPLPLISYGGSFMVSTMMAFGLIQSVYVRRYAA